jgi:NH3-dependent NAD+ synthetase
MNEDTFLERQRNAGGGKTSRTVPYTAKDFQLEVLDHLAEMQALTESLRETVAKELKHRQEESRLLRFDGRTLVAIGAIALSMTGYVLQDARRSTRRDADIESSMARLTSLERVSAINTESRIRTEVEMSEIRAAQTEMMAAIDARGSAKQAAAKKF